MPAFIFQAKLQCGKNSREISSMNLLIIGSGFSPVHHKLKALGHRLFIIPDPSKKMPANENGLYEAILFVHDVDHIEQLAIKICSDPILFNINRVIAFNEKWQLTATRVASRTNLPIIIDGHLVNLTVDKYSMRKHLERAGVPSVKFEKITHYHELADALHRIGFPAILKPLSGEASKDIYLIEDEFSYHQIASALENNFNEEFLLESFIYGDEYSVEAVSYQGQHHILAITKKYKNKRFIETGHVLPAPLAHELEEQIKTYIQKFLSVMNFNNCPSHTEIILSNSGPVVIESHTRPGGDNIYRLLEFSTGIDLMNIVAKINTGTLEEEDIKRTKNQCHSAVWYSIPEGDSHFILEHIEGLEEARKIDHIEDITLLIQPGENARHATNSFDRSAFAIATAPTASEALHSAQHALSQIKFTYSYHSPKMEEN
ncbi:ATP-grasp domain-containing protein [Xenorhabdus sp. ZM]|uniref:ATP-grasp domain-containing protein n=1 Tax=Xenorhabdus szentirmaii TaxID=290112 RepID=UPI0019AAD9E6|nr:ATP-grasp domain-containing protein [Xenorhabdus sp. ZM]MBD2803172.1 ATP-grasp domain-containing protein [Xenorhabdus sp. ZM]